MSNKLEQLRKLTTVVADTGEIDAIKKYQPEDATTNPSLILKAAQIAEYAPLIDASIEYAKAQSNDKAQQVQDTCDMLAVNIGKEILKNYPRSYLYRSRRSSILRYGRQRSESSSTSENVQRCWHH